MTRNFRFNTRTIAITGACLALSTLPLAAMEFGELDANGDGAVSYGEMLLMVPNMTEEAFVGLDSNADQVIDPDEFGAAIDAGTLPMTDG